MTMQHETIAAARAYLTAGEAERAAQRPILDEYVGDFEEVIRAVRPPRPDKAETGWILSRQFRSSGLAGKYPEQPFSLYVPPDYDASKAYGLLIFLHGGGQGGGDASRHVYEHYGIRDLLEESGRIVCLPSAPPSERSWSRWHLPEVDEYLADLIAEVEQTYHLDADNMVLGGSSMGGMGALHLAHRFSDRFASVLASASHWDFACWHALHGTTLWILHGVNDANLFRRRHGTDIEFARAARLRLEQAGVDHVYREHSGGHAINDGRWIVRDWLRWSRDQRRDPFYPHVVAVTPRGLTPWSDWRRHKVPLAAHENVTDFHSIPPAPHARWITIEGLGAESILFDMVTMSDVSDAVEEDWNNFSLTLKRKHVPGGLVEAVIRDDQATGVAVIEVTPRNVTSFTLWLHPEMVDFREVRVLVRGKERFRGELKPSLVTLLDSYRRRRDWGLLYPAKVTIADDGTWATNDQLKIGVC